jgi:putative transposase
LISESYERQHITPGTLTVHADNGKPMVALTVGEMMVNLGVEKSHSRPHTSNDNPFSEALFKTVKYRPEFPDRFASLDEARAFCQKFFTWYNEEHRHSGIAMLTPASVHNGKAHVILNNRSSVLAQAFEKHPERFVKGQPVVKPLPDAVWINPPVIVKSAV